jgi:hypothetical protein
MMLHNVWSASRAQLKHACSVALVALIVTGCGQTPGSADAQPATDSPNGSGLPLLVPSVWPGVIAAGEPTEVLVSVTPRGAVDGTVSFVASDSSATLASGTMDEEAGTYTAAFDIAASDDVVIEVTANVDGSAVTGMVTIVVADDGLPVGIAPFSSDGGLLDSPDGGQVLADQVIVRTAPDAQSAELVAAAESVGGTVVGRLSDGVSWQVQIEPPAGSWSALSELLDRLQQDPAILTADPEPVATVD